MTEKAKAAFGKILRYTRLKYGVKGKFSTYLYERGHRYAPRCQHRTSMQTPEHVLLYCDRYEVQREDLLTSPTVLETRWPLH